MQGGSFSTGLYYLTGKTSMGQTAQQVYVDSDGWMLVYRHEVQVVVITQLMKLEVILWEREQ